MRSPGKARPAMRKLLDAYPNADNVLICVDANCDPDSETKEDRGVHDAM